MVSVNERLPQHESWHPSTKIPSYLNIKEIKIELKAFLSNKYVRKKAGTSNSSKGIHSCWKFCKNTFSCKNYLLMLYYRSVGLSGCRTNGVSDYRGDPVVISPDGQRHRQLLSSKDGLSYPFVLDYDRSIPIGY